MMVQKVDKLELGPKEDGSRVLAANTNYATTIRAPVIKKTKLKFIQLPRWRSISFLVVVVVEGTSLRTP